MKKIKFFIISILLMTSLLTMASYSQKHVTVGIQVAFGRRSQGCQSSGICYIKIDIGIDKTMNGSSMTLDEEKGTLTITTSYQKLIENQPDKINDFKDKNSYNFIEDWVAPEEINKALQATKPIKIKAGTYPLYFKDGNYSIVVTL